MASKQRGLWIVGACVGLLTATTAAAEEAPTDASKSFWERTVYPPGTGFLGLAVKSTLLSSTAGARFGFGVGLADEWFFPANFSGRAEVTYQYFTRPSDSAAVPGFHSASVMLLPRYYLGTTPAYLELGGGALFNYERGDGTSTAVAFHGSVAAGMRFSHLDVAVLGGVINADAFFTLRLVEPGIRLK
ncbi:MAG: hypothetical protein ACMG6S_09860 [Byssovorax sp.]